MQESKIQALDEGNGAVARPGREEAGVKTASPRTETYFEAGGGDELAPYNKVPDSLPQVKHGVVPGKLTRLLGETLSRADRAAGRNRRRQRRRPCRGVSRGRSSAGNEPGVGSRSPEPDPNGPEGLTHARRTKLKGRTVNRVSLTPAMTPYGRAGQWRLASGETDTARSGSFVQS